MSKNTIGSNAKTIRKRRCGYCTTSLKTDAAGLMAHSYEKHGECRPPRPESLASIRRSFSPLAMMNMMLGRKGFRG